MDYKDRIKQIKSERKITNEQLAQMTGIPLGTMSKLLAGISDSPKLSNMVAICEALDCSLDYIVSGIPENTNNYTLNADEIVLLENYRALDVHGRELVVLIIKKEYERIAAVVAAELEKETKPITGRAKVLSNDRIKSKLAEQGAKRCFARRKIYLYDMPVSAGTGVYLDESRAEEITIPDTVKTQDADFALRISGNSMEPRYHDGDVLLIQNCDSVEVGELGVFVLDGSGYFKMFGGDRLISLNPKYGDILLKDFEEITCTGRVVGKLKKK